MAAIGGSGDETDDVRLHRVARPGRRRPAGGKRATCHWLFLDRLREFGADPVGGRFVEDGKVLTAAGVSAGIDMALHLVGREAGPEVAQAVQLGIEYDPQPPYDAGSPSKAPREIVDVVTAVSAQGDEWLGGR